MYHLLLSLVALTMLFASPARAACGDTTGERGIALLIGISDYRAPEASVTGASWAPLGNAVNDVELVCEAMSQAGFGTIILRDPTYWEIDSALIDFQLAAREVDNAIVYYAGHGFEFGGQSYLVPVDAPVESTAESINGDFVAMQRLLDAASEASEFGLFFMDACRTRDPVIALDTGAGGPSSASPLGLFTVPTGAVIFSTVSGRPALDEAPVGSSSSPFARAVVESMQVPGLELQAFYASMHEAIVEQTSDMQPVGPQYPALYKITPAEFYLVEPGFTPAAEPVTDATAVTFPPMDRLATVDEPQLLRELLQEYSIADIAAAAEAADPVAEYLLGYAYNFGLGVRRDVGEALTWLERSAAQEHPGGMTELAYFLQQEAGDAANTHSDEERDAMEARALALYEAASEQGYAKAQSHLALALMWGTLGVLDYDRGQDLLESASAAGHVYATYALAMYGEDAREAGMARLREIADSGNVEGNNWLCNLHYTNRTIRTAAPGGPEISDCEVAALNGYMSSRVIYAEALANGWGIEADPGQASYFARLALAQPEISTRRELQEIATWLAE